MQDVEALTNNSLRSFAVFARHRNFTSAANELHISQPSLHTKIKNLGLTLDVELYERRGRGLVLTSAGEMLAKFANESETRADSFVRELQEQPTRVRLFAGRAMLRWVLDDRISDAIQKGVEVDVVESNREAALAALADGLADVAGLAADAPPSMLCSQSIARVDQVLIVSKKHPLAKRRSVRIEEIAGLPLVLPSAGRPHRQRIESAFTKQQLTPVVAAAVDGWDLMSHMASLGLGATIVNGLVPTPKGMAAVKVKDLPSIEYWLAWRPERDEVARSLGCSS